ncbi:hypothetical protein LTR22_025513 [Elasticomyces elasticus]|nr:hypothetical protein LTR22_025513 [Elasticomyces elasticus]
MRLLKRDTTGGVAFTKDLPESELPQFEYAILSHTWGPDQEEVSYEDVRNGNGTSKLGAGAEKIRFCIEQTRQDRLDYFWVDTCCINKKDDAELSRSLRSMFRWYAGAKRCYVYLSDVPQGDVLGTDWERDFQRSRWFRRGWTLQELIAPSLLEFYSKDGKSLGTKASLEVQIGEITGIPVKAIRGRDLPEFTIHERWQWQEGRQTREPEDLVYSLLGLLDISMPVLYGEGIVKAQQRLDSPGYRDFTVPFSDTDMRGVEKFVGRKDELNNIHAALVGDGSRHTVILNGLGGIGKTQLAVAYAKRYKDKHSAVFWLNIRDEASVKQSFAIVARRILRYHPSASHVSNIDLGGNLNDIVNAVLAWLGESDNTRWLAIFDNYDNPKVRSNDFPDAVDIRRFLPDAYQGSVIITTRSSEVKYGQRVLVRKLKSTQESVDILSNTSRRALSVNDSDVTALVKELDGLPLALATTGAYLEQASVSVATYLRLYKTSWSRLHEDDAGLETYEDRTLYSTWQISLERIQQQNELSAKVLSLWCYFGNRDLWYELLLDGDAECLPWLRDLTERLPAFIKTMRLLCNYGLAESDTVFASNNESGGYSIHACVHAWTIHVLNKQWDDRLAGFAVSALSQHVPGQDAKEPWTTQRRLVQHAERCLQYLPRLDATQPEVGVSIHNIGHLLHEQNNMHGAEEMYLRALRAKEEAWGLKHTSTLSTVNNLANLYSKQGKMQEAKDMYLRALRGYEEAWGPKHTSTLDTVNNFAILYFKQDKMQEAEEMYLRVLRGYEEAWGSKHTSTLDTVNNLALLYKDQGKMKEAEEMYLRALRGYEEAWGPKHTSTLDTVNNLAALYKDQGKMQEAEEMYVWALRGKEEALGPKHTSTLDTVNNLAILYSKQDKMQEAEEMYLRVLRGYEEAWGPKHTSTLSTVNNLAILYSNQGKIKEAEQLYLRALQGYEEAWGPKHTSTLVTVNNLASLYSNQGKTKEAEELYLRTLRGKEKAWGSKHTSTLDTVNNLANIYFDQGKMQEAEELFLQALRGYEEAWGPKHTSTLDTVNNLAVLYSNQGKMKEAEEMYLRALRGKEEAWGPKHTSSLDTVNNLAILYKDQGKMQEAEEMYMQALRGYEEAWGLKHASTLDTVNNLAILYFDQGKMKEAEEMYIRALRGKEEAWGPKHTSTLDSVNNLAIFYKDQGKIKEAEEMYLRALRGKEEAWGPKHTSTLDTVNNLAVLYFDQGKMQEAEKMYLRALRGKEEAWGPKHTSTLGTVYNVGLLYSDQGRMQEAEEMFVRALEGYQNVEGDHEADIEYLQEQLKTLRVGRQTSSQHPQSDSRDLRADVSSDGVDRNDRTARMRDFVLRVLMQP